jgi:hypothetical protein
MVALATILTQMVAKATKIQAEFAVSEINPEFVAQKLCDVRVFGASEPGFVLQPQELWARDIEGCEGDVEAGPFPSSFPGHKMRYSVQRPRFGETSSGPFADSATSLCDRKHKRSFT